MKSLLKSGILIIGAALALSTTSCREKIDGGNEGVLVDQYGSDKGQGVSLIAGSTWYNPWSQDVFQFPLFVQNADYAPFEVSSKGGPVFRIAPRITYVIQRGKAPEIFRKYRKDIGEIEAAALNTYTRDAFRNVFGRYTPDFIVTSRDSVENQVTSYLSRELEKDGFQLQALTYSWALPPAIQHSIDAQANEVAKTKQVESRLKTAEMEAREKIIVAEAEARANELRQRTLTPMLIQQQFIEKWDGRTPLYGVSPVNFKQVQ